MLRNYIFLLLAILSLPLASGAATKEEHLIAGAGPSTELVKIFFAEFARHPAGAEVRFNIMENSVKHLGGIRHSDTHLFGRTGRPLNDEEKSLGKREILLGEIPAVFAKGLEVQVDRLDMGQIEKIFTRQITNWKDVGGTDQPIMLAGREKKESVFSELQKDYPFFAQVTFDRVFKKDDELVQFLLSPLGRTSIGFAAAGHFAPQNLLAVPDLSSGVKVGLVYDGRNEDHPLVQAAREWSNTPQWRAKVTKEGYIPVR